MGGVYLPFSRVARARGWTDAFYAIGDKKAQKADGGENGAHVGGKMPARTGSGAVEPT